MIPLCRAEGIGIIPWSPLARGFLTGNRSRDHSGETIRAQNDRFAQGMYYRDDDFAVVDRIGEVAARRGVSNAEVALAWLLRQPGVTAPIIGATKPRHLEDAVRALNLTLDDEELAQLAEPYRPHPVLGHGYDHPSGGIAIPAVATPAAAPVSAR
jgi:aryl-alcohol dehydrogenase (NADP+)